MQSVLDAQFVASEAKCEEPLIEGIMDEIADLFVSSLLNA